MGHYTGWILKPKRMTNEEARELVGDRLVNFELADYYIERDTGASEVHNGKQSITLKEFIELLKDWEDEKSATPFFLVKDGFIDTKVLPTFFWEFYDFPFDREDLIVAYHSAYYKLINKIATDTLKEFKGKVAYELIGIDYHN